MLLAAVLALGMPLRAELARDSEIVRDEWGVPHIYGKTDASVVYAHIVAQGEDNFVQLEEDLASTLGRSAEIRGEDGVPNDLLFRAFECERKARDEYRTSQPRLKRLADAYAAGLETVFHGKSRVFDRFEPWVFFASEFRPEYGPTREIGSVVRQTAGPKPIRAPRTPTPTDQLVAEESGSNAWAVAPSHTANRHAILFSNPHVGFFGGGQRYEVHLESAEGWRFSGFTILSSPLPHAGHNARLGWSHTNTGVDTSDQYLETFDDPADPLAYRYGSTHREAVKWRAKLRVRVGDEVQEREYEFTKTHHGPIVGRDGDKLVAFRTARGDEGGYWREKYAMGRAQNLAEFKKALAIRAITGSNTTYADADGHIAFWYGNCVPKRSDRFDWTRPVDGADPETEWRGYHALSEIPKVIDPPGGWVQNCNSTFATTAASGNPDPMAYPRYFRKDPQTLRSQNSRRILASQPSFSYGELTRLAFDTTVYSAIARVPVLLSRAKEEGLESTLRGPLDELARWDLRSSVYSVPMTLYMLAETMAANGQSRLRQLPPAEDLADGLAKAVQALQARYGTWRIPWGEINRLQRPDTFGRAPFDAANPSLPVPGASGGTGIIFAVYPRPSSDPVAPHFGIMGDSYVSLVEFGPSLRARSIVTFGQSGDPASPHYFDQAPLYAKGEMKPAWFTPQEVHEHTVRRYSPP